MFEWKSSKSQDFGLLFCSSRNDGVSVDEVGIEGSFLPLGTGFRSGILSGKSSLLTSSLGRLSQIISSYIGSAI